MTEPAASPGSNRLEKVKNGAAILGAIASAVVGLYGVYEKVRSDARADTAASYNTLAPQVNQMGEALKQLQAENQQLREIVAEGQNKPRMAVVPPAANTRRRDPASAKAGKTPDKADKPAPTPAPTATPGEPTAATAQPANGAPPAASPTAATPAAPEGTATQEPPATNEDDRITGLLRTVGRTREAIENLKKVPEDFGRVVGKSE